MPSKNFERFSSKLNYIDSLSDIANFSELPDGIYTIKNQPFEGGGLDFIFNRNNSKDKTLLVFFSGAITNRDGSLPPFFSGVSLSKKISLPFLSISDPSLEMADDLGLAWYAGNNNHKNLQSNIAYLISMFENFGFDRFLLIGGSGGGFSALIQYLLIPEHIHVDLFIWNPQTNILNYDFKFVSRYIDVCFKSFDDYEDVFKKHNLIYKVSYDELAKLRINGVIVYLQSSSDWHFKRHFLPFFNKEKTNCDIEPILFDENKKLSIITDDWSGHNPPSKFILEALVISFIYNGYVSYIDYKQALEKERKHKELLPECINILTSEGIFLHSYTESINAFYAFYLKKESKVLKKIWYSDRSDVFVPGQYDKHCEVTSFVKVSGDKISSDNPVAAIYGTLIDNNVFVLVTTKIEGLGILINNEKVIELNEILDRLLKAKISYKLGLNDKDYFFFRANVSSLTTITSVIPVVKRGCRKYILKWFSNSFSLENLVSADKQIFRERFTFARGRHKDVEVVKLIAKNNLLNNELDLEIRANSFVVLVYKMVETFTQQLELSSVMYLGNQLLNEISNITFKPGARNDKYHLTMSINTALAHGYLYIGDADSSLLAAKKCNEVFASVDFFPYYSINYAKMLILEMILSKDICDFELISNLTNSLDSLIKSCESWIEQDKGMWSYEEVNQLYHIRQIVINFFTSKDLTFELFCDLISACLRIKNESFVGLVSSRIFSKV